MTRLLLDQGLARDAAALLRKRGLDVRHVGEIGMGAASDSSIIAEAIKSASVIVTLDADFHSLVAVSGGHTPSVIRIRREGLRAEALAQVIEQALVKCESALAAGALVSITERTLRIHPLPVNRA